MRPLAVNEGWAVLQSTSTIEAPTAAVIAARRELKTLLEDLRVEPRYGEDPDDDEDEDDVTLAPESASALREAIRKVTDAERAMPPLRRSLLRGWSR